VQAGGQCNGQRGVKLKDKCNLKYSEILKYKTLKEIEMKRDSSIIKVLILSVLFVFTSCEKEINTDSPYIDGLSIDNYPIVDGSTSTLPLNTVIACELLGLNYEWQEKEISHGSSNWSIEPKTGSSLRKKFDKVVKCSQTHNSIINLIDRKADIVLTARTLSSDEQKYAEAQGVTLIETPIALDAFIFIVNPQNSIVGLTTENIQDIYTGKITDWREFGVEIYPGYSVINPFIRNPNSGSQELMDLLVMKGLEYYTQLPIYEERLVFTMQGLLDAIGSDPNAIGYTVYYYNEYIIRPNERYLKTIAIDGVKPNKQSITNRSYPYTAEVYAVIRSDTDKTSITYKIYEWLQTIAGKQAISKSGYILN
jgi:phosphate transport system substrate-binding protein